jgi:signal transduction histidine kinase
MPQLFGKLSAAGNNPFDFQIERLIALLRLVFTSYCLVFFISEPTTQPQFEAIKLILAVHTIFGTYIALRLFFGGLHTRWQLPVHLADIVIISTLIHLLGATSTTFLILCVFVLLSATVRWNWRGALWTTTLMVALQILLVVASGGEIDSLVQYTFLIVIGGMFAFFGASRERSYNRLMNLAAWSPPKDHTDTVFDNNWLNISLMHAAAVLEAPRILLLWEVAQEPSLCTAVFVDGKCKQDNRPANIYGDLVAPELISETFFSEALHSFYCTVSSGKTLYLNPIINSLLQKHFSFSSVCSVPFIGEICKGRLFVLDRPNWDEADLTLAKVVASQLRIQLEHHVLCVQLEENTASRERNKLARDLHDGILQSLTAAGLQLKTVSSRSEGKIQQDVENVRKLLITEQKRIRGFVEGRMLLSSQELFELSADMERELNAIQRQWGCDVVLSVSPKGATVSQDLGHQLKFILAEASANAVRHGQASRIDVAIETIPDRIRLRISDNGHGLEAKTRAYSQNDMSDLNIGPQSLRKRIAELNGSLSLLSSPQGVELHVELPFCSSAPI